MREHELVRSHEVEPRIVDVFAVLDMDRTLLNTDAVTELLCRQLGNHGVPPKQIEKDIDFIRRQEGTSFSLLDFFGAQYGPELYSIVKQEVEELVEHDSQSFQSLLCDGTAELLEALGQADIPYAILTFGERANQDFKLSLLRKLLKRTTAELHASVTEVPNKAVSIADTWAVGDRFAVPAMLHDGQPLLARRVVVVDDKTSNLESDNPNVVGFLVDNTGRSEFSTAELAHRLKKGSSVVDVAASWQAPHPPHN